MCRKKNQNLQIVRNPYQTPSLDQAVRGSLARWLDWLAALRRSRGRCYSMILWVHMGSSACQQTHETPSDVQYMG